MPDLTTKDALLEKIVELTGQIKDNITTAFGKYLPLAGGTMTGAIKGNPLTLTADDGNNSADLVLGANGSLSLAGNDIAPQKSTSAGTVSDVTVPSGTVTNMQTVTLAKGTWLIQVTVTFPTNATGYRQIGISTNSTSVNADRYKNLRVGAANGASTVLSLTTIIEVASATTYYINVQQDSGGDLDVGGGYKAFRLSSIN